MSPARTLRMSDDSFDLLIEILKTKEARVKMLANMAHTTETERTLFLNEAVVLQHAYLQLEGIQYPEALPGGAPDWSND